MTTRIKDIAGIFLAGNGVFQELTKVVGTTPTYPTFHEIITEAGINPKEADGYYFNYFSPNKIVLPREVDILKVIYNFNIPDTPDGTLPDSIIKHWTNLFVSLFTTKYERLLEVVKAEYSPIENYDRYEDLFKEYSSSGSSSEDVDRTNTGTQTNDHKVEGFNSSTFQDSDKDTRTDNLASTDDIDRSHSDEGEETNTNHIHGNIGVTQATDMLQNHWDFWSKFNVLEIMCRDLDTIITTQTF